MSSASSHRKKAGASASTGTAKKSSASTKAASSAAATAAAKKSSASTTKATPAAAATAKKSSASTTTKAASSADDVPIPKSALSLDIDGVFDVANTVAFCARRLTVKKEPLRRPNNPLIELMAFMGNDLLESFVRTLKSSGEMKHQDVISPEIVASVIKKMVRISRDSTLYSSVEKILSNDQCDVSQVNPTSIPLIKFLRQHFTKARTTVLAMAHLVLCIDDIRAHIFRRYGKMKDMRNAYDGAFELASTQEHEKDLKRLARKRKERQEARSRQQEQDAAEQALLDEQTAIADLKAAEEEEKYLADLKAQGIDIDEDDTRGCRFLELDAEEVSDSSEDDEEEGDVKNTKKRKTKAKIAPLAKKRKESSSSNKQ